jgi:hypothetical protein
MRDIEAIQRERGVSFTEAMKIFGQQQPEKGRAARAWQLALVERATTAPTTSTGEPATASIKRFDALVDSIKAADPRRSFADCVIEAAKQAPDLARERNAAVQLAIGPGGLPMHSR